MESAIQRSGDYRENKMERQALLYDFGDIQINRFYKTIFIISAAGGCDHRS
jgi:hypothetical protein